MRLPLVMAAALAVVLAWGLWQRAGWVEARAEVEALRGALSAADARERIARQAADVRAAALARMTAEAAQAQEAEDAVRVQDGAAAPASDFLRTCCERVR